MLLPFGLVILAAPAFWQAWRRHKRHSDDAANASSGDAEKDSTAPISKTESCDMRTSISANEPSTAPLAPIDSPDTSASNHSRRGLLAVLSPILRLGAECAIGAVAVVVAHQLTTRSSFLVPELLQRKDKKATATTAAQKAKVTSQRGGIPLKEVVRFRERQWVKDELEAAKLGDTGSMVRLAKLHLAGAGCAKDIQAAKYWVHRARKLGAWVSLEELIYDGPDPPPFKPPSGIPLGYGPPPDSPHSKSAATMPTGAPPSYGQIAQAFLENTFPHPSPDTPRSKTAAGLPPGYGTAPYPPRSKLPAGPASSYGPQ